MVAGPLVGAPLSFPHGTGAGPSTLQSSYDNGNTIATSGGRIVSITGPENIVLSSSAAGATAQFRTTPGTATVSATSVVQVDAGIAVVLGGAGAGQVACASPIEARAAPAGAFQNVRAADPVILDDLATKRYVDALPLGEVNTASNLGPNGPFATKVGADLRFKNVTSSSLVVTSTPSAVNLELPPALDVTTVLFTRRGTTNNFTFLDVDDTTTGLPFLTIGGSGWPYSPLAAAQVRRVLWRSRLATAVPSELEVFRTQGDGITGTSVSLGILAIPAGVLEFDSAPNWPIPAGPWTLVARRAGGGGGAANRWFNVSVILEVS